MSSVRTKVSLSLVKPAKGSGGDKYKVEWEGINNDRERFFYVPQNYSRNEDGPKQHLSMIIQSELLEEGIEFKLYKEAKSNGDDRYRCENQEKWKGDIYIPRSLRSGYVLYIYMC